VKEVWLLLLSLPVKDPSSSTIQRQRRELQLLMAELKDRERELNAMSASHQRQHQAWEQDRETALVLERRCSRLDDELQRSNEVISVLTKHVWVVESREKEAQMQLGDAKQLLCELEKQQQQVSQKCQDYEAKNQSLSSAVMALSTQVGSLQVREEELSSMLKLKDKDVVEASGRNLELSARLQDLETSLAESRSQENKLLRDLEEMKRRYREAKHEQACQEPQIGESWKDELLELSRSKQERIMSELLCLQQVCENQRSDLQLLRLNQERTQRAQRETHHQQLPSSVALILSCLLDKSINLPWQPLSCTKHLGGPSSTFKTQLLLLAADSKLQYFHITEHPSPCDSPNQLLQTSQQQLANTCWN
uniref:Coiled-coil domain containing 62 n=1 Tax=Poecilia reticulata TaxID=8081 RepID=A0A3P9PUX6_POERE